MTARILLCDDEHHILRASQIKFTRAGFDVHCATDGEEAWQQIQEADEPFDILITDYQMPRLNGLQLVERIRGDDGTADLPVVLLTAKGFELDEAELQQRLRIINVVAKPFSPRELLMTVSRILEGEPAPASIF